MFSTFVTILPIFSLIILGKLLRTCFFKSEEFWRVSEKITYYVLFPALLIHALIHTDFHAALGPAITALALATLLLAGFFIILQFFLKTEVSLFTSIFQGGVRYNSYIFLGVAAALYGTQGIAIVAVIISYMIILTNALSVIILDMYISRNFSNIPKMLKNLAKNPLILASITGILCNQINTFIPSAVSEFLHTLGGAALPLSLLCVGAGLHFDHLYHKFGAIISASVAKLIFLPILALLFLSLFHVTGLPKLIAILYSAVPCAGNAYILAQQMGGDAKTMAAIISVTTLASIITIPIILALVH